jgi:hypothetical protein
VTTADLDNLLNHILSLSDGEMMPSITVIESTRPDGIISTRTAIRSGYSLEIMAKMLNLKPFQAKLELSNSPDSPLVQAAIQKIRELAAQFGTIPTMRQYIEHRGECVSETTLRANGISWRQMLSWAGYEVASGKRTGSGTSPLRKAMDIPLTKDDLIAHYINPPEHLDPKLKWSTGGLMALGAYQNRRGETCYVLR